MQLVATEFRQCLENLDVQGVRRLWQHIAPHLPQPKDDAEALLSMHLARTKMVTITESKRSYSRAWLEERYSLHVAAVGIAVKSARAPELIEAMSGAVKDCIKSGIDIDADALEVRTRIKRAALKA